MKNSRFHSALFIPLLMLLGHAAVADTVKYEYDELGRLTRIQYGDGSNTTYVLDPAGNRTQVTTALPPEMPASITVPPGSATGSYTIEWGIADGTVTSYELYEDTNSSFSSPTLAYEGSVRSKLLPGRGNGTYSYRVRACNGSACSGYRTGSNPVSVILAGIPAWIDVPSGSNTGDYTVSWGTSSGTATAYKLYEDTNSTFSSPTLVYNGAGTSKLLPDRGNGTYYYRVRACNSNGCGSYRTGGNAISVTLPPGVPASITVPPGSETGSFTISWGLASGTLTTYKLYEDTNSSFSSPALVYNGTDRSKLLPGRGNGTYYYRVRACNGSACSGYRTGSNALTVTLPPGTPTSISITLINDPNYRVSWGASSGTVASYKLYRSFYSNFSSQTLVYSGTGTSKFFPRPSYSTTYYFRVRACNSSGCSGYRASGGVTFTALGGGGGGGNLDSVDPGTEGAARGATP
ncbi:MAG TPA: hypothetical protein VFG91_10860 [Woeseiaceae bacterium]|nr:hypothetical protein [Woeseiaceae bacterium]